MNFNLVDNIEYCFTLVNDSYPLTLIYYSHLTSLIISLLVGFFVFIKSGRILSGKLLLSLSAVFSLWVLFNLILWTSPNSAMIMFLWSLSGLLIMLMFGLSLYLAYVFTSPANGDMGFSKKVVVSLLFLPVILLTPTDFNLTNFSILNDCEATENGYFTSYYYLFGLLVSLWIFILATLAYRKADNYFKKQIILFSIGIEFFILSFFESGFIASLTNHYEFEFYGIISMTVFMAFLAYLIVQYEAFNTKLLGTQALVVALILLIGSQFFFVKTKIGFALAAVTFTLVVIAGIMLIRLFKRDEERKQQLQYMADSLAVANDQLRKLDNAKSEFISIASHQLRTPLTAIKGYISLLMEGSYGKVDPSVFDVLNKVYTSNERLIQLVENLLNISRMESGRMQYHFEPTQIEEIIRDLYDTFVIVAKNKKLFIKIDLPDRPLPKLMLDSQKMHEVLSNLIDNGLKYTQEGGVTLTAEEDKDVVRVTVADTGIGIPATEIPHLFTKFSRGKDVSRLHANGTGLGLYVVKNIIEAHHGKIWIESEGEGNGSRFIIELPKGE
jgi:signal transduction histidine kinase